MSVRTALRRFAASATLVAGLTALAAFAQTPSPRITAGPSVADADIAADSAVVRWSTDVESSTAVDFGTTTALGQTYRKIVPIEETEITEINHSMSLWSLAPGTKYYYRVKSSVDGGGTVQSDVLSFTTKANACTADTWDCGAWGTCAKGTDGAYAQSRACTLTDDCLAAETPKPATTQACTPACTADVWDCGAWGTCSSSGNQSRVCTLKTDCPTAETPKPVESQNCTPACTADKWTCAEWGACSATGSQLRKCTLVEDCPAATTPKPAETQACTRPAEDAAETRPVPEPVEELAEPAEEADKAVEEIAPPPAPPAPAALTADFEKNTEGVSGGFGLMGAPGVTRDAMTDECAANGILPERCDSWLETKYADDSCAAAGLSTKEACERFLSDKAGGVFPGCEGASAEECDAVKARATLGYLPEEEKKKVDEIITTKKVSDAFDALGAAAPQLVAVRVEKKDEVVWYPSAKTAGQETSPGVIVFDTDKDGIPDDAEKRLGTDPRKSDVGDADGTPNAVVARAVLKSFFQAGDKPTGFVLIDTDGDGKVDLLEDRKLLGLKQYDPSKVYVIGDTTVFSDALGVDTDGDGVPNAKVSREVLKSFFEKGDKPTEARGKEPEAQQFGDVIDSSLFSPVDLAFFRGNPIEQPRGTGETDPSFGVALVSGPVATDREIIRCKIDDNCPPEYPFCRDGYCYGDGRDVNGPQEIGTVQVPYSGQLAENFLKGTATPNSTVVLYVYSYVPMVLTTTTDENGNFEYDLADNVVDGKHEVYVAVTDDTGKIAKKSEPLAFFVKGAIAATSEEDFLKPDVDVQPDEAIVSYARYYVYGTVVLVLIALGFAWRFMSRMKGGESKA